MKTTLLFAALFALSHGAAFAASAGTAAIDQDANRLAMEANAPEGVEILRVTVSDATVHVLATAGELSDVASFLKNIEASDAFAAPDLEFTHALSAGGNLVSLSAPSI